MQQAKPKSNHGAATEAKPKDQAQPKTAPTTQPLPGEAYGLSVKYFRWGIQQRGYTRIGWRKW